MAPAPDRPIAPDLVARASCGETRAQEQLYDLMAPGLRTLARRLTRSHTQADDLFQESMLTMLEQLAQFRGEAPLAIWLRRICLSRYLMQLRSPWHRARVALMPGHSESLGVTGDRSDALDLEAALSQLPPTTRAVVWLFEVEGYTHQEIASEFGRSVSFSKSQLSRAHRILRAWFGAAAMIVVVVFAAPWAERTRTPAPVAVSAATPIVVPGITRAGAALATADLEDRIAVLDDTLTAARLDHAQQIRVSTLQQHRAELAQSLDLVRRAEAMSAVSQ